MADETVAAVSMSLDEPEIVSPVAATVDTPAPETPASEEAEPEGVVFASNGEKLVPLKALQSERGKRKDTEKALAAKDAEIEPIKAKAQRYDEASQYLEQARPIIEKIKARPDILKLADHPPAPPPPVEDPALEAEAADYARDFDLFTADGKPDVERAKRIMKRNDERAARQTQQAIHPILQTEAQRQSTALYQQYLNSPEQNGIKVDPRFLAETWNSVPPEVSADPRVAQVLFMNTIGRQMLAGHKPIQALPPTVPTESLGAGTKPTESLNHVSEGFQRASGIAPKDFKAVRESYKPGQPNSLE